MRIIILDLWIEIGRCRLVALGFAFLDLGLFYMVLARGLGWMLVVGWHGEGGEVRMAPVPLFPWI